MPDDAEPITALSWDEVQQIVDKFTSLSPLQAPTRQSRSPLTHHRTVRSAAEPCRLSSVSPPRNSYSDLRLISAGARHESTSPASKEPASFRSKRNPTRTFLWNLEAENYREFSDPTATTGSSVGWLDRTGSPFPSCVSYSAGILLIVQPGAA